jgi:hypothetical protein
MATSCGDDAYQRHGAHVDGVAARHQRDQAAFYQLLGEIESGIVGTARQCDLIDKPEVIKLQREPENPHNPRAIRVENESGVRRGRLPWRISAWLAPLLDAGKILVDGCVRNPAGQELVDETVGESHPQSPSAVRVTLSVFLHERGRPLLSRRVPQSKLEALHQIVLRTYEDVQSYGDADLVIDVAEGLKPLARQELMPETRLLLALIPGLAEEIRASRAIHVMAARHERCQQIHNDGTAGG